MSGICEKEVVGEKYPPSKIISINPVHHTGAYDCGPHIQLFVLCEDGSVFVQYHGGSGLNIPDDGLFYPVATPAMQECRQARAMMAQEVAADMSLIAADAAKELGCELDSKVILRAISKRADKTTLLYALQLMVEERPPIGHRIGGLDSPFRRAQERQEEAIAIAKAAIAKAQGGVMRKSKEAEITEEMIDAPRHFLLGLECGYTDYDAMRKHMCLCGADTSAWPAFAYAETGHITKAAQAVIIYSMMRAAVDGEIPS